MMEEEYLNGLLIPSLIEGMLQDLLREQPSEPRRAVEVLQQSLAQNAAAYYTAVCARFESFLQDTPHVGFRSRDSIRFVIPHPNGTMEELFPGGRHLRVTPQTFDSFAALCSRKRARQPITAAMIPLNPKLHLMGNYLPVADFLLHHVSTASSGLPHGSGPGTAASWFITKEEWDEHQVGFCVPFKNVLHDLCLNGRNLLVPFDRVHEFASTACALLRHPQGRTSTPPASTSHPLPTPVLEDVTAAPVAPTFPPAVGRDDVEGKAARQPSKPLGRPAQPAAARAASPIGYRKSSMQQRASLRGIQGSMSGVDMSSPVKNDAAFSNSPSATLLLYHEYPELLAALSDVNTDGGFPITREEFEMLDAYYVVPLGGKIIPLIPDGELVPVRFKDKDWFVHIALEKLGLKQLAHQQDSREAAARSRAEHGVEQKGGPIDLVALNKGCLATSPHLGGIFSPARYCFTLFQCSASTARGSDPIAATLASAGSGDVVGSQGLTLTDTQRSLHLHYLLKQLETAQLTQEDCSRLGLTFSIENKGVLVDLVPNGSSIQVSPQNKGMYISLVRELLQTGKPPSAASGVAARQEPRVNSSPLLASQQRQASQGLLSPFPNEVDLFTNSYLKSSSEQTSWPQSELGAAEREFWQGIVDHLDRRPESASSANGSFAVLLPDRSLLLLKTDGDRAKLTPENAREFVKLAREKEAIIHAAFVTAEHNLKQQHMMEQHHVDSASYPLVPEDLQSTFFEIFDKLSRFQFSPDEIENLNLTYAIPKANGTRFDLIPNGQNIRVHPENFEDFLCRVTEARNQLTLAGAHTPGSAVEPGGRRSHRQRTSMTAGSSKMLRDKGEDDLREGDEEGDDALNPRHVPSARQMSCASGKSFCVNRSIRTIPLSMEDIQTLEEYELHLRVLGETEMDKKTFDSLEVTYCIHTRNFTFDVIPNGRHQLVDYADRERFIALALEKIADIKRDQRERESAVPPDISAEAKALFSPNHFAPDLFSPPQQMTLR